MIVIAMLYKCLEGGACFCCVIRHATFCIYNGGMLSKITQCHCLVQRKKNKNKTKQKKQASVMKGLCYNGIALWNCVTTVAHFNSSFCGNIV